MTLTEFLQARIAEDELNAYDCECVIGGGMTEARMLAECETKRDIIEEYLDAEDWAARVRTAEARGALTGMETALKALAPVYRDHPDFDPAWAA